RSLPDANRRGVSCPDASILTLEPPISITRTFIAILIQVQILGDAARTSELAPLSYCLKLLMKRPASFLDAASYAFLSDQVSRGEKFSEGTPGHAVTTSKPKVGSRCVLALANAPLWTASRMARVWASLIRLPAPYAPPLQPVLISHTRALCCFI